MKKLCLILTLLLVFLSGCSHVPSDPLPKETEGNTEPVETTGEIPGIEAETTTPVIPQVSETTPWYLSWDYPEKWNMRSTDIIRGTYEQLTIPEELNNYAIKVPIIYETETEGVYFKVEFFQEYYLLDAPIQAKIMITNNTGEDFQFHGNTPRIGTFENVESTEKLSFSTSYPIEHKLDHYTCGYYNEQDIKLLEISYGETVTYEVFFVAMRSPYYEKKQCFFLPESSYTFGVTLDMYEELSPTSARTYSFQGVEIPIEVVEVERVD